MFWTLVASKANNILFFILLFFLTKTTSWPVESLNCDYCVSVFQLVNSPAFLGPVAIHVYNHSQGMAWNGKW